MDGTLRFRVLGPIEARAGERPLPLAGPKQRTLLALLLLHAEQVVTVDRILEALWEHDPPPRAVNQVQGYISALRRALGDPARIETHPAGYLLRVGPGEVDLAAAEQARAAARAAAATGELERAAAAFEDAERAWRGRSLGGTSGSTMDAEADRLDELRLAIRGERIEVDLARGRHAQLVPELTGLVAQHPFDERLRGQLMLALYRCGRRAEALAQYREGRTIVVDELGIEPGQALSQLERAILHDDPRLQQTTPPPAPPPPCQLPAAVGDFVGRREDLDAAGRHLTAAGPSLALLVINGPPGVGKSALAVHLAHSVRPRFPDGQLFAGLRGAGPRPVAPEDVLEEFLRTLGIQGAAIPETCEERARRYRAQLADRRVLIVLDDAADEAQVRPLLPGTGGCAVLVTSRKGLEGLEGARWMRLGVPPREDAVELLGRVSGRAATAGAPDDAARVVELCGRLPLAVRIAGARLATRPELSLADLAGALANERRRLDELAVGDLEIRAGVGLGYDHLEPEARRGFRRLGLLQSPDFPGWTLAALVDVSPEQGERLLTTLTDVQLVEAAPGSNGRPPRYRLHDLVRLFAREQAEAEEPGGERAAALRRVWSTYLALAERGGERLMTGFLGRRTCTAVRRPLPAGLTAALLAKPAAWFGSEHAALVSAVRQAANAGEAALAWGLAASLAAYFEVSKHFEGWRRTHEEALAAAEAAGDQAGVAVLSRNLGELHSIQDRYADARRRYLAARAAAAAAGDGDCEAAALIGLGHVSRLAGRYREALDDLERAIAVASRHGNAPGVWYARHGIAVIRREQGRLDEAWELSTALLAAARDAGTRPWEAAELQSLGMVHRARGRIEDAAACFREAWTISGELGDRRGQARALQWLGEVNVARGRPAEASAQLRWCLAVHEEYGDRFGQAIVLWALGELALSRGHPGAAVEHLERSLAIWARVRTPYWWAQTLGTMAAAQERGGRAEAARVARRSAAELRAGAGLDPDGRTGPHAGAPPSLSSSLPDQQSRS